VIDQPPVPAAPAPDTGMRTVKIVALVVIALVVLCGLAGTCLFLFTLISPLISGIPTAAPPLQ
jgi:hypothetical protein